jgi:hypothetical protein
MSRCSWALQAIFSNLFTNMPVSRDRSLTYLKGWREDKKKGLFTLLDKAWSSFKELKRAFASPPILRHFNPTRLVKVVTNTSRFIIAGILLQPVNGIIVP